MVLTLKIIICIFLLAIGTTGFYMFQMFKGSLNTAEYEESSLLGKLLNQLLFIVLAAGLLSLSTFLIVTLFSTVTIN